MRIRAARESDLESLLALLEALFALEADFGFEAGRARRGLELLMATPGAVVLVAEDQGRAIAMASVQTVISTAEGGPVGWLEDLVVAAGHRRRGVGARLLAAAEQWAATRGLGRLQLLADRHNAEALDFYRRQGWSGTGLRVLRKFPGPAADQGSTTTPRQNAT